ncbi:hypothetical protein PF003_g930 [Phytophthora fragariae]|nr:hypothetical protein PF003_g930 [Phytophthora fragariae]
MGQISAKPGDLPHLRAKGRVWTPEEIEQAMRDNERLNATPAAPEEPAVKKRRQARRRSKCYNLNKEFQALNVAGEAAVATVDTRVSDESNSVQPPPVRSEERSPEPPADPIAPDNPTAAAAAPSEPEQPPASTNAEVARTRRAAMTASQQERTRARDRERVRIRRANMTVSQRDRERRKNAERIRARRALLTETDRERRRVIAS